MAYIGRDISNLSDRAVLDSITASATATYNLLLNSVAYVPSSAESLTVSLNGVIQKPQSSYTVSGSTIVFDSALTSSDSIDFIIAERAITLTTVGSGSVGTSQLVDGNVTTAKIADSAVTNAKITDGTIANAKLANSSITLNGSAVSLGGSATIGGGGKIGQVIQTVKTDVFSTSSSSLVDVTGLTASITPSATDSKVLVCVTVNVSSTDNSQSTILFRDSTRIAVGDASGNRTQAFGAGAYSGVIGDTTQMPYNINFLDSPNKNSATVYKIQGGAVGGGTLYYGRGTTDNNDAQHSRTPQTITLMEVLA